MTTIITRAGKGSALTATEFDTNHKRGAQTKSGNYTVVGSDNRDTIEVTAAATITLTACATLTSDDTGDFEVTVKNKHTGYITVARSSTDTIDGATSYIVNPGCSATFKINQASDGFNVVSQENTKAVCFDVTKSSTQAISSTDPVLVTWETENIDSHGYFASNKFTPLSAGKYYFYATLYTNSILGDICSVIIMKNGSTVIGQHYSYRDSLGNQESAGVSAIADANGTTDYFEVYTDSGSDSSYTINYLTGTRFIGYRIGA